LSPPSATTAAAVDRVPRDRLIVLGAAAAIVAISWAVMIAMHGPASAHAMTHPHPAPAGLAGPASAFAMWMVMMVGMMLPPVLPWILLYAAMARKANPSRGPFGATVLFGGGYFAVWALFSALAALVQVAMQRRAWLSGPTLRSGELVGGILLLAAGSFQLTPLKSACLKHCRSPLSYFLARWSDGPAGAMRMGLGHGVYCVSCCWALMLLSFALGVMNLLWMALLTLMLCAEKIGPRGLLAGRVFGAGLAAWGLALLIL